MTAIVVNGMKREVQAPADTPCQTAHRRPGEADCAEPATPNAGP